MGLLFPGTTFPLLVLAHDFFWEGLGALPRTSCVAYIGLGMGK